MSAWDCGVWLLCIACAVGAFQVPAGASEAPPDAPRAAVSPSIARLEAGGTAQFEVTPLSGESGEQGPVAPRAVEWSVNGKPGGGQESGTITGDGLYTAPDRLPAYTEVSIAATIEGAGKRCAWATVLLGPDLPRYGVVDTWRQQRQGTARPVGTHAICLEAGGNVVVSVGNRICRFTRHGRLIGELPVGAGPGGPEFGGPRAMAVDAEGNIYMVDGTLPRVFRFNREGGLDAQWGEKGSGPGQFMRPHSIAVGQAGRVYIGDVDNGRIQVYDTSGKFLFQWGERGTGPGQFMAPHGIFVDPNGDVFVVEYDGRRCQKFTPDGKHLATFAQMPFTDKLTYHSMAGDSRGNVYLIVRDQTYERSAITKYNNAGDFITSIAPPAKGGRLFMPECAAVGSDGRVYVTAKARARVAMYVLGPATRR